MLLLCNFVNEVTPSALDPNKGTEVRRDGEVRREQVVAQRKKPSTTKKAAPSPRPGDFPAREPFTAEEQTLAAIPGMPDARFWSDSVSDFKKALPAEAGPWLVLSSGGGDGAFGAGLLNGWTESGKRPEFSVVTGVSTGALMAPYAFVGSRYDPALRAGYTTINAGNIFEAGGKGESFLDTWPLKEMIDKQVDPQLLAAVAAEHQRGKRLFVVTTNLDAERYTVWNMGAIAAHGGEAGLKLFRNILLASTSIPGLFPPVLIDVEAKGHRFQEMHADGGLGGQFFVAPDAYLSSTSTERLPATELYIIVNTQLTPVTAPTERTTITVLGRSISAAVKTATNTMIDRTYAMTKRSGIGFNLAVIEGFITPSRGPFDPGYMQALFQFGYEHGKNGGQFLREVPDFSARQNPVAQ
jgi:hypothetical protein